MSESGRLTEVSAVQLANAPESMVVKHFGKDSEVSPLQKLNALLPMTVNFDVSGNTTEVNSVQWLNTLGAIFLARRGTTTLSTRFLSCLYPT